MFVTLELEKPPGDGSELRNVDPVARIDPIFNQRGCAAPRRFHSQNVTSNVLVLDNIDV